MKNKFIILLAISFLSGCGILHIKKPIPPPQPTIIIKEDPSDAWEAMAKEKIDLGNTFLLIGQDANGLADTIEIIHLDLAKNQISIIPVYRDTRVRIPGSVRHWRLNHGLFGRHIQREIQSIENLFGVKINGFILFDFRSTKKILKVAMEDLRLAQLSEILPLFSRTEVYKDASSMLRVIRLRKGLGGANLRAQNNAKLVGFLLNRFFVLYKNHKETAKDLAKMALSETQTNITPEQAFSLMDQINFKKIKIKYFLMAGKFAQTQGGEGYSKNYFLLNPPPRNLYEFITSPPPYEEPPGESRHRQFPLKK